FPIPQRPWQRTLGPIRAAGRDGRAPGRSPALGCSGGLELDHGLKAGGVAGGAEALLVQHAAVRDRTQHEAADVVVLEERLHLARDVPRANGRDERLRQRINPKASSRANASSAAAMRFSPVTSTCGAEVANAVRTGAAAMGIAKCTNITV